MPLIAVSLAETSLSDILMWVAVVTLTVVAVMVGALVYVVFKYRVPLKGLMALGAAIAYVLSPVDVAPEAILGPLGLVDDVGVFSAAFLYARQLGQARRLLRG